MWVWLWVYRWNRISELQHFCKTHWVCVTFAFPNSFCFKRFLHVFSVGLLSLYPWSFFSSVRLFWLVNDSSFFFFGFQNIKYRTTHSLSNKNVVQGIKTVGNVAVPGLKNGMDYMQLGDSDLVVSKVCMGTVRVWVYQPVTKFNPVVNADSSSVCFRLFFSF
jgi:hypothetical protein